METNGPHINHPSERQHAPSWQLLSQSFLTPLLETLSVGNYIGETWCACISHQSAGCWSRGVVHGGTVASPDQVMMVFVCSWVWHLACTHPASLHFLGQARRFCTQWQTISSQHEVSRTNNIQYKIISKGKHCALQEAWLVCKTSEFTQTEKCNGSTLSRKWYTMPFELNQYLPWQGGPHYHHDDEEQKTAMRNDWISWNKCIEFALAFHSPK
jgi:hypothetical protein